jgi:hypothetical protein
LVLVRAGVASNSASITYENTCASASQWPSERDDVGRGGTDDTSETAASVVSGRITQRSDVRGPGCARYAGGLPARRPFLGQSSRGRVRCRRGRQRVARGLSRGSRCGRWSETRSAGSGLADLLEGDWASRYVAGNESTTAAVGGVSRPAQHMAVRLRHALCVLRVLSSASDEEAGLRRLAGLPEAQ